MPRYLWSMTDIIGMGKRQVFQWIEPKTVHCLRFAPEGSLVIRISHTTKRALRGNVLLDESGPMASR